MSNQPLEIDIPDNKRNALGIIDVDTRPTPGLLQTLQAEDESDTLDLEDTDLNVAHLFPPEIATTFNLHSQNYTAIELLLCDMYMRTLSPLRAAKRLSLQLNSPEIEGWAQNQLTRNHMKALIGARVRADTVMNDEILYRLGRQATFDIGDYIVINEGEGAHAKLSPVSIDWSSMLADGATFAIKSLKYTKYGLNVEFYDQQHALELLAKIQKMFRDESMHVRVNVNDIDVARFVNMTDEELRAHAATLAIAVGEPVSDDNGRGPQTARALGSGEIVDVKQVDKSNSDGKHRPVDMDT